MYLFFQLFKWLMNKEESLFLLLPSQIPTLLLFTLSGSTSWNGLKIIYSKVKPLLELAKALSTKIVPFKSVFRWYKRLVWYLHFPSLAHGVLHLLSALITLQCVAFVCKFCLFFENNFLILSEWKMWHVMSHLQFES